MKRQKRFNSTSKPLFPNHPTKTLATLFADLLSSSLPIHLIPGPSDPAGATLPQQPLPKILFGGKAKTEGLECETNPTWMEVGGRRYVSFSSLSSSRKRKKKLNRYSFLTTGGQAIDDIFKYVPGNSRLGMTQRTLEWRHMAPTAPDTLWIYPFPDTDPFIMNYRPDVYIVGNQPEFETTIIGGMTLSYPPFL